MKKLVCKCEDSNGEKCGKPMSKKEFKQDRMCSVCADQVWKEMSDLKVEYKWFHQKEN